MNYTIPIPRNNVTTSTQVNAAGHPILPGAATMSRRPMFGALAQPTQMTPMHMIAMMGRVGIGSSQPGMASPTYPTGYNSQQNDVNPHDYNSWRNAFNGGGVSMSLADFGRRNVQESVHNPAEEMYSSMPAMAGMATPAEMQANQGLGQRWQKLAQQRNLQSLNTTLSTEPVERQLDRSILAANMGLGHADLGRRMQASEDEYGLAKQGRKLSVARMLYGG